MPPRPLLAALLLSLGPACKPAARPPAEPTPVAVASPPAAATPSAPAAFPDGDHDRDGVPDTTDACPDVPEDRDEWEDDDGCPDRDNDRDRVPDAHEWTGERWTNCDRQVQGDIVVDCRLRPEDFDGFQDRDGCPEFDTCANQHLLSLTYDPKTLRFAATELDRLDAVLQFARQDPDLDISVRGHTGKLRDDKLAEQRSRRVAEVIIAELVRRGIPSTVKFGTIAAGDELPIDDDNEPAGWRANHRVELFAPDYCGGKKIDPDPPPNCG